MSIQIDTREAGFAALAESLRQAMRPGEDFTLWYSAEASDFIRFNHARVRQAGHVSQAGATLQLIAAERQAQMAVTLSGQPDEDRQRLADGLERLRAVIGQLPPDPYLMPDRTPWQRRQVDTQPLPDPAAVLPCISAAAEGLDLVGIYAAGPLYRGFANSWGAFGWHSAHCFNFDFSLFHANGQAVKADYAGQGWNDGEFHRRFAAARAQLEHLGKPLRVLAPGGYRAYIAPAALEEITGMLCWGGFSARALATKESPLQRLDGDGARFSPLLGLHEQVAGALSPAFTAEGSPRSDVALIEQGRLTGRLVGSRSAREYGLAGNGASGDESPQALVMDAGTLPEADTLAALGTGLYIGNLWYLNWSDLPAARITGMTRFATFWVEDGRIQAPVSTMRFDDSLFDLFGEQLEALTAERQLRLSASTYGERQTLSSLLPGALVKRLQLTL